MQRLLLLFLMLLLGIAKASPVYAVQNSTLHSAAFFYAAAPPLDELKAFDVVVVDPDTVGITPQQYNDSHSELFAYISVGEADPARPYFKRISQSWLIGENRAWKSKLVDLANPAWRNFFLDQVVEPLWREGYRGFFLDTLDSYQLVKDTRRHQGLEDGLVQIIRELKGRHPEARLILNRGFEVLERVKDVSFAVAAESLYQNFDPVSGNYGEVQERDRQWLVGRLAQVHKDGLPVIAIDYVAPKDRALARKTAEKIKALGFIPWVTDKDLASLGVGAVEVLPRKVLGLYDGSEGPDPMYTALQRIIVMPLNYLGYQVDLYDMRKPLPEGVLAGRYAGVVIWPNSADSGKNGLLQWLKLRADENVKVVFLERFGVPCQVFAKAMGLAYAPSTGVTPQLKILNSTNEMGFEVEHVPLPETFCPVQVPKGKVLLSVGDGKKMRGDAVAITPWGGYALEPYLLVEALKDRARWVVNPFAFLQQALRLPSQPVPDTTSENGVRLLFSHIDADGFESRVERPGGPLAVVELRERILKKYRIPTTFSVITSALGDQENNTKQASVLQAEAREVFKLPWIEAGSHTFSHPFYWQNTDVAKSGYSAQYLPIPGYSFQLATEIPGSIHFIEHELLPPGKKVKLLQWSGDCVPGADALAAAYRAGVGNINGGDTQILESNNSLTEVAPLGVKKGKYFQVFAANQNENIYTNDWTGPFYGYRRVIETFRLTDTPRRLKPINIYYHVYSATKDASRQALEDVYHWVLAQKPYAIYTSEYVDKVFDFNRTVVARSGHGWLIRNKGDLRQLRLPISAGYPDLTASHGIVGFSDHNDQRYIHVAPSGEAYLELTATPPTRAWVSEAAAKLNQFDWTARGIHLAVSANTDGFVRFGGAAGCQVYLKGKQITVKREVGYLTVPLTTGSYDLELVCK